MYEVLVLSGGALRGFALLGALQALMDRNQLTIVHTYIGTSVGAIIAYLLCIGYTPVEILVFLCKEQCIEQLATFDLMSGLSGKGVLSFSNIRSILETMTYQKMDFIPTLLELQTFSKKQLICCTYNHTKGKLECLDAKTYPSLCCLMALQMSSSLPLLFEPILYDGCIYMDGALISNFPLFRVEGMGKSVLGIRFCKQKSVLHCQDDFSTSPLHLIQLCYELLMIPIDFLDHVLNHPYFDTSVVIEIDISDCDHVLNFSLTHTQKLDMFSKGYESVVLYSIHH